MRGFADCGHEVWVLENKNSNLMCYFSVGHTRPDVKMETLCGWIVSGLGCVERMGRKEKASGMPRVAQENGARNSLFLMGSNWAEKGVDR